MLLVHVTGACCGPAIERPNENHQKFKPGLCAPTGAARRRDFVMLPMDAAARDLELFATCGLIQCANILFHVYQTFGVILLTVIRTCIYIPILHLTFSVDSLLIK